MLHNFFNTFEAFAKRHQLICADDRIVVGVSGGIDSIVLLDLIVELKSRMPLEVSVAHINHKLRGEESDGDEEFVKNLARDYGIECYVHAADTKAYMIANKISLQAGAREIRYKFYRTVKILKNYTTIATAHNANDNAETVLFNLLRGTGSAGLGGIPVKRDDVIRPLLFAERDEIAKYAKLKSLKYREDSSNIKDHYTRNFIRHNLLPQIKEKVNPGAVLALNRSAEIQSELERFIRDEADSVYPGLAKDFDDRKLVLDISKLRLAMLFVQENIIMKAFKDFVRGEVDFAKVHAVMDLLNSETGSSIEVGSDVTVYRDRLHLVFMRSPDEPREFVAEIIPGKRYEFESFYFESQEVTPEQIQFSLSPVVEFVSADLAGTALTLRNWQPGDWFMPLGMTGKKKVSDFLIDSKMPIYQKDNVMVLSNMDGIIWLCGLRLDDRFKITDETRRILRIEFGYK